MAHVPATLPADIAAECALNGSALLEPEVLLSVATIVPDGSLFFVERNGAVWDAILDCFRARRRPDLVNVQTALEARGTLDMVGGMAYLMELQAAPLTWTEADRYAATVADKATLRAQIRAAGQIAAAAYKPGATAADAVTEARTHVDALGRTAATDMHAAESLIRTSYVQRFPKTAEPTTTAPVVRGRTGVNGWDDCLKVSTRAGKKITLAGYTGFGKSTLAAEVARGLLIDGWQALIYTGEMPRDEVIDRYLTKEAAVTMDTLALLDDPATTDRVPLDVKARIVNGYSAIEAWTTYADEHGGIRSRLHVIDSRKTMREIEYRAANLRYHHPQPLVVVIDHLGLVNAAGRAASTYERISENAIQAKQLAMQVGCLVIELAQLNREISRDMKANPDAEPELHMMRDSGEIEQSADAVLMLQPSRAFLEAQEACETQSERERVTGIVNAYLRKHRNGPKGVFSLMADFAHYTMKG